MAAPAYRPTTLEEYFALEERSDARHEFIDGEIVAMAGGSDRHDVVISNLHGTVYALLKNQPCRLRTGNMRVKANDNYLYPDLSVVCGKPQLGKGAGETLLNPTVIFEVLSPSTELYDRGAKFEKYQQIESLKDYVLIAQDRVRVERYTRHDDGRWLLSIYPLLGSMLSLTSIGIDIPLDSLYEGVDFPGETRQDEPAEEV